MHSFGLSICFLSREINGALRATREHLVRHEASRTVEKCIAVGNRGYPQCFEWRTCTRSPLTFPFGSHLGRIDVTQNLRCNKQAVGRCSRTTAWLDFDRTALTPPVL
jgi:hypothetical protein